MVPEKGFGFIREVGSDAEYFFHRNDLTKYSDWSNCVEGWEVSFLIDMKQLKGPRAYEVSVLGQLT
jgi:cold shock CspA family protein